MPALIGRRFTRLGFAGSVGVAVGVAVIVAAGGCSSGPKSTRVQTADIDQGIPKVRESLAESAFSKSRDGASAPAVLVALRPDNLSNERLSESDQAVPVSRVLLDPGVMELLRSKNVRISVTPGERDRLVYFDPGSPPPGLRPEDRPTHGLKTEYRSRTRAASLSSGPTDARRDFFNVTYTIVDLRSGKTEWAADFDISRVGFGLVAD